MKTLILLCLLGVLLGKPCDGVALSDTIYSVAHTCAVQNMDLFMTFSKEEVSQCISTASGISRVCSDCVFRGASCIRTKCFYQCLETRCSTACKQCAETNCLPALQNDCGIGHVPSGDCMVKTE